MNFGHIFGPEESLHRVQIAPTSRSVQAPGITVIHRFGWGICFTPADISIGPYKRHRVGVGIGTNFQNYFPETIICHIHKRGKLAKGGSQSGSIERKESGLGISHQQ